MSGSSHAQSEVQPEHFVRARVVVPMLILIVLTAIAWGTGWAAYLSDAKRFAFSWLFSAIFYFTLAFGALFWVLLHHATNSSWSAVVRRLFENMAALLPWAILALLPVILLREKVYKWFGITEVGVDPLLDIKRDFLNEPFFLVRYGIYFLFFTGVALVLRHFSVRQDASGDPRWTIRAQGFSYAALLPFALILTAAGIDYLMALDFHWFSTMWGVYLFAGAALSSMAVLIITVTLLRSAGYLTKVITVEHYHIMGKLLFAFTVFWAYIAFSQYFLIWYANIPEETVYFLRRNTDSWHALSIFLVIGHFMVPFLLLIFRWIKKSPVALSLVCCWILLMHLVDMYLIVLPTISTIENPGISLHWFDFVSLVAVGAPLVFLFLWGLSKNSLVAHRDPRIFESLALKN
ncbi:MAG: hypothetical protein ACFCU3_07160 [Verrucomicrobiales bacterium]